MSFPAGLVKWAGQNPTINLGNLWPRIGQIDVTSRSPVKKYRLQQLGIFISRINWEFLFQELANTDVSKQYIYLILKK